MPEHSARDKSTFLLAGIVLLALVLRFWRLGDWNFQATEIFTLRDSLHPRLGNPRPLGYLLNYYLVGPFAPLDEFGLRILPAVFGALAIPALYFVTRRLIGPRAAGFSAFLLAISPLHIMYSQLARYWSLVFLLSTIYPYALYIGIRERNRRALALGLVTGVLAALAHPVAILLLVGPALVLATPIPRERLTGMWSRRATWWTALVVVLLVVVIAWRFVPLLQGWISGHQKNPGAGQFLHASFKEGVRQIVFLVALVDSLTFPLVLASVAGLYLLWREPDTRPALFLASLVVFPLAFIMLVTLVAPVSQYYLVPALPVFFITAGAFLHRLFDLEWGFRPRWLVPTTVVAIVVSASAPTLVSEYLNGRRYDFRSMAEWLKPRLRAHDIVFADQPMVLAHYLPGTRVNHLRADTTLLAQSMRGLHQSADSGTLWVVAPSKGHRFRTDLKGGGLIGWIYEKCQLRNTTGTGRVDFRQQYLHVYRCPPAGASLSRPDHVVDRDPRAAAGISQ